MKTLYLMRHAETESNVKGLCQGHSDSPLTDKGVNQAKCVQEKLYDSLNIDHIYASPLKRAIITAKLASNNKVPIEIEEGLIERYQGDLEGKKPPSIEYGAIDFKKYNAETNEQLQKRIYNAITKIMKKECNNVLCVSHGAVCRYFLSYIIGPHNIKVENCAILKFEFENNKFKFIEKIKV